jgi:uncharacterized cupin superfamily protein
LGRIGGVNLRDLTLDRLDDAPDGRRFSGISLTEQVGATLTGMGVYELEPGNATWPYHFEFVNEEWLIVMSGEVVLRTPEGKRTMRAGDVAVFPVGAKGAHEVRNEGTETARFLMPSTVSRYGDATIYPDSGKFAIGGPEELGFWHRGYLGEKVPYWEGEP